NVGGLLLTANDPVGAAAGLPYLDAGNNVRLAAAAGSTAAITVQAGAQISATNPGSYVVAVAPRFDMAGAINVNGSAALAAVGDVNLTLNGGLFDITANVGSDAGGTSSVTGSIGGPAGIGPQGVNHRVYLMAVPRNDAMTLLITGGAQIGFDVAAAADVDGNAVVLSGGYNLRASATGTGLGQFGDTPVAGSAAAATIIADNAAFTSEVTIRSKNSAQALAQTGDLTAAAGLTLYADQQATVAAAGSRSLIVAAGLTVDASTYFNAGDGATRQAGTALVSVQTGSTVQAGDAVTVLAVGRGNTAAAVGQTGGTGRGGTAQIDLLGGTLRGGDLFADAGGNAGASAAGPGGSGFGGTAGMTMNAGATAALNSVLLSAVGSGDVGASGRASGSAQGGNATLLLRGATLAVPNTVRLLADATYAARISTAHLGGGQAVGGTASVTAESGTQFDAADLRISADSGGFDVRGNNGFRGGDAILSISDVGGVTGVRTQFGLLITALARASNGQETLAPNAGAATGGFARLIAQGSPVVAVAAGGLAVTANGIGGQGLGGSGGDAFGGRGHVDFQDGGTLALATLNLDASARGGSGTVGGNATAFDNGDGQPPALFLRYGSGAGIDDLGFQIGSNTTLTATATAGNALPGAGGAARGGLVSLVLNSGSHNMGRLTLEGSARGGDGGVGGDARSGRLFQRISDASLTVGSELFLDIDARAGSAQGSAGERGGDATVGQISFFLSSLEAGPGAAFAALNIGVTARAVGGAGTGGAAGGGAGGNARAVDPNLAVAAVGLSVQPARSTLTVGEVFIDNRARGGSGGSGLSGSNGGAGGTATGGFTSLGLVSGPVTPVTNQSEANFGNISVSVRADGGSGGFADTTALGGRGGSATGGQATILSRGGILTANNVDVDAGGFGGTAGFGGANDLGGGNGTGGSASLLATPHFTAGLPARMIINGDVSLGSRGGGGGGEGGGGIGRGGTATIELKRHEGTGAAAAATAGTLTIVGAVNMDSDGVGGDGRTSGNGGDGFGGTSTLFTQIGTTILQGPALLQSDGVGGVSDTGTVIGGGNGGAVNLGLDGGDMTLNGTLELRATGVLGRASGGAIRVTTTAAGGNLFSNGDNLTLDASAGSGDGFEFGPAGDAFGGGITIEVGAGSLMRLRQPGRDGSLFMTAAAEVLNLGQFSTSDAYGGGIAITADGRLELYGGAVADMIFSVESRAGAGGSLLAGGEAFGGGMDIRANAGGSMLFDTEGRTLRFVTTSVGGDSGLLSGSGGGSGISLVAVGGSITTLGAAQIEADGLAGNGPAGGEGSAGGITLQAQSGGTLGFGGPLSLLGRSSGLVARGSSVSVNANDATINVGGDVTINTNASFTGTAPGIHVSGGFLAIDTVGTSVFTVTGGLNLAANGSVLGSGLNARSQGGSLRWNHRGTATITGGISATALGEFGDGGGLATGGGLRITAFAGRLSAGQLDLSANADGGVLADAAGLVATGGTINLETLAGAELAITGFTFLEASGQGASAIAGTGGRGEGGQISVSNAGIMRFTHADGGFGLQADGDGGDASGAAGSGARGGGARGGTVALTNNAGGSLTITAAFGSNLRASAGGGSGSDGASAAIGGSATIANAGNLTLTGGLQFGVTGIGRNADGTGGVARIDQSGGFMSVRGDTEMFGRGDGGGPGSTGVGTGGTLAIAVAAGTMQFQNAGLLLDAEGSGINGVGGSITLSSGGNLSVATDVFLQATSRGGFGNPQTAVVGGAVNVAVAAGGRLQTGGLLDVNASAETDQAVGGTARGGQIGLASAGTVVVGTNINLNASTIHDGIAQNPGLTRGGDIAVTLTGGSVTAAAMELNASSRGMTSFGDGGA
ncbi:MAG: hypothetical protein RIS17_738, partial [Pseudomonadota bacterium]